MDGFLAKPLSVALVKGVLRRWVDHEAVSLPADTTFESAPSAVTNDASECDSMLSTTDPCACEGHASSSAGHGS